MRILVVAVGRVREAPVRAVLDEYFDRIRKFVPCDEIELSPGDAAREAAAFTKATAGAFKVALEVEGKALASPEFAKLLDRAAAQGKGKVAYLVGGADGLPAPTLAAADARVSMSALTLPHRLARLVLVEQLYRAMTILRGVPYAH